MNRDAVEEALVALERASLDRWCTGDPCGFAEHAVDDVTYFDHVTHMRVDGRDALEEHLQQFVGAVDIPRHEMANIHVRSRGDVAVLTFNWESFSAEGERTSRWNVTEVFVHIEGRWRYAHIHWAPTAPGM